MRRISVIAIVVLLVAPRFVFAQSGGTGMSFLKIGSTARTIAMGDAGVSCATSASSVAYNPALLALEPGHSINVMHNAWIQDITTDALGAGLKLDGWSVGINMVLGSVGDIEVRDVPGAATGTFDARNFSAGLTIAVPLEDWLTAGVSAKYLFEKIYVDAADGYAFDLGVHCRPFTDGGLSPLTFGLAASNLGSMSKLRNEASKLPALMRYGASYSMPLGFQDGSAVLAVDGVTVFDEHHTHLNMGIEAGYDNVVFLRAGYQTGYDTKGISAGLGVSWSMLRFDYAFIPFSDSFGSSHTFSLSAIL